MSGGSIKGGGESLGDALTSIKGLTTATDKMIYTTASDTYAVADLSSFARTLLDDTTAAAMRATLDVDQAGAGGASTSWTYDFSAEPLISNKLAGGGQFGSGAGNENMWGVPVDGMMLEWHNTNSCTVRPTLTSTGVDFSGDQIADRGRELTAGIQPRGNHAFTVGTDAAFYCSLTFTIEDVSGTDDCAFGFRRAEDYNRSSEGGIDAYTDFAVLNVISGNINIETNLNSAGTTTTDTTDNWADGASHKLEVLVSATGVVTYQIDDLAPTTTAAFTFDDGDVVIPFFYFLHDADLAGAITLEELSYGLQ